MLFLRRFLRSALPAYPLTSAPLVRGFDREGLRLIYMAGNGS